MIQENCEKDYNRPAEFEVGFKVSLGYRTLAARKQ